MTPREVSIAIVGGGGSGVLAASNLRRALGDTAKILLIEKQADLGRGLAYSTEDPSHLLNVRVSNMSAFPDDPDHFFRWLQRCGPRFGVTRATRFCFVPRRVYGAYVASLIESPGRDNVEIVSGECIDVEEGASGVRLTLASGRILDTDLCVLATGIDGKPRVFGGASTNAWQADTLVGLAPDSSVLIIGTGLTMVDTVLSLERSGHRGTITAISRRGLLSSTHREVAPWPIDASTVPFGAPISRLARWIRARASDCERQGGDWRSAIDAIRPHTRRLWTAMSIEERRRFLRHARPWWDVHRHRMAPGVAEAVARLIGQGRLRLRAGRIVECEESDGHVRAAFRPRGAAAVEWLIVDRVFESTGLLDDPRQTTNGLVRSILARGVARPDALRIGLDVADDCALVGASGDRSTRIFAIGPLSRAQFWEIVAIPDIRVQCAELATRLAARLETS